MNKLSLAITTFLIFAASVSAGAVTYSAHDTDLATDSVSNSGIFAVLTAIESGEFEEEDPIAGALSAVCSITTLDYVTSIYESIDFYQSGYWEGDGNVVTTPEFSMELPEFDQFDFYRPSTGSITSRYGYRPAFGRLHKGVDIALNIGDTVRAALPGVVIRVDTDPGGYGNFVVLAHSNGVETRYAHLSGPLASVGQKVKPGEPIALGGNTGNSTGPHLHFEIRYKGTAVNPLQVFDFTADPRFYFNRNSNASPNSKKIATGLNATKVSLKGKRRYVVRQGDTVESIASRAGISAKELRRLNALTPGATLAPGTLIKLK